ncbi:hypothetical protein JB92DRAFT_1062745 [Gautieria morchelliformis]|nr:hypothetical protein JB92DRAFT_1062745 [Gautieria morchelliformis]
MPINEPSWKIRSRLCPFYSRGKCFFAENCSFLHQTEGTPSATRVDDPGYSFSQLDNSNSGTGTSVKQPYTIQPEKPFNDINRPSRHYSNTNTEQRGSDSESDPDGEGTSDVGFPTIRKAILPLTGSTRASGFYRDSMATVKADSYGSETTSRVASFHSLPHHHPDHPKGSSFSNRSKQPPKISVETELSLSSLNESAIDGSLSHGHTPTSAISATAQEVEVPVFGGLSRTIPAFTLANSSSSSLIANRLAKSRGPAPHSPPIVTPAENPSTPFSAGALYASYYEEIPTPTLESPQAQDTEVDAPEDAEDAASPEHAPLASHVAPRTHAWLKPLRLVGFLNSSTSFRR